MRYSLLAATLALTMITTSRAQENAAQAPGPSELNAPKATTKPAQGEAWRFVRRDGLWWYWLPTNKWVIWTDGKWVPYDPQAHAQLRATRRSANPNYSYSGGQEWGNWGPVRYNQYGQPQYPYSQRTTGMRQLGPVPAAGGVRSLPGWGGER